LKCKSVCAGHEALMIAAAFRSSDADKADRGCCTETDFSLRGLGLVAASVDIF
jgi:hypothetical protein